MSGGLCPFPIHSVILAVEVCLSVRYTRLCNETAKDFFGLVALILVPTAYIITKF